MFCVVRNITARISVNRVLSTAENCKHHPAVGYLFGVEGKHNLLRSLTLNHNKRFAHTRRPEDQDPLVEFQSLFPLNDHQISEITGGDPSLVKKLRVLQMEFAVQSVQYPGSLPKQLLLEQWKRLLPLGRIERKKYLVILCRKERPKLRSKEDEAEPFADISIRAEPRSAYFDYKLFRNAIYPMIPDNTIGETHNKKLAEAIDFGPTIIMDCEFERVMSARDVNNTCQQLVNSISVNRQAIEAFNMVFCNLDENSLFYKVLWAAMPNLHEQQTPIITTNKCYSELYPRERLVYLSPHVRDEVQYDPQDIYIIGAMVDKSNPGPHSLIKAKSQGIRVGTFPLDKYLLWKSGSKSLTLNQVVAILHKIKSTGSWSEALEFVPKRKISLRSSESFYWKKRMYNNAE